jgi:hypothetical protein
MDEIKIELKNGYEALKEIYFQDGKASILTYKWTKTPIVVSSLFVLLSLTFFFVALVYPETGWIFLMTICALIALTGIVFCGIRIKKFTSWRNSIQSYLESIRKYEYYSLTLSAHTFELSNSDETFIEKWENIRSVSIRHEFISIKSTDHSYILPEKSMTADEYVEVQNYIKQRMNDDPSRVVQAK